MSNRKIEIVIQVENLEKHKILLDNSIINDIMKRKTVKNILTRMGRNPKNIRFKDLCKVCDHYFGSLCQRGSSHRIYRTPWPGDPRINIQNYKGKVKAYQVRRVLLAVEKLESENGITE